MSRSITEVTGQYIAEDSKVEQFSVLTLLHDSTFFYYYMLGGCQDRITGKWTLINNTIRLRTDIDPATVGYHMPDLNKISWTVSENKIKPDNPVDNGCFIEKAWHIRQQLRDYSLAGRSRITTGESASRDSVGFGCLLDPDDHIFTKVDIQADFSAGRHKWWDFVQKNFDFRSVAKMISDTTLLFQDSIVFRLVVPRDGGICSIQFLKGNRILWEPTVELVKASPWWEPGSSEGRQLNTYRTLKIGVVINKKTGTYLINQSGSSY